jgi:hypothetical protein
MRPEQCQQQRDFFLRTDLNHVCLLFASLVGSNGGGVQDDLVSGLFQDCFVVVDKAISAPRATLSASGPAADVARNAAK